MQTTLYRLFASITQQQYCSALRALAPDLQQHDAWLRTSLPVLSPGQLSALYTSFHSATQRGLALSAVQAQALAAEAVTRLRSGKASSCFTLYQASLLSPSFQQASVNLSRMLQLATKQHISAAYLNSKSLRDLHFLLLAYSKSTLTPAIYETKEGANLLSVIETVVLPALRTASSEDIQWLSGILRTLIGFNGSTEVFLRALETVIFEHLDALPASGFRDLLSAYPARVTSDYRYIQAAVLQPYITEVVRRAESLTPAELGSICLNIERCRGFGLYCTAEVLDTVEKLLGNEYWLERNSAEEVELALQRIVHYIGQVSSSNPNTAFTRVTEWLLSHRAQQINPLTHCRLAQSFAQNHFQSTVFWSDFTARLPNYIPQPHLQQCLHNMLVHVKYLQPDLYPAVPGLPTLPVKSRFALRQSSLHHRTMLYLSQRKIPFRSEFVDDFHIDIALVERKIAIELCGISHYVVPAMLLDTRTLVRKLILEKKGWTVLIPPFHLKGADFHRALDDYFRQIL